MGRTEILNIVRELLQIINEKRITPNQAEAEGSVLQDCIRKNNEQAYMEYRENAEFYGKAEIIK